MSDQKYPTPAAIEPLMSRVEPEYKHMCRQILLGKAASMAQAWQDWWMFHNLFPERLEWGGGVYIDIGTNDPTAISNTLFFDKCLGWRGVCFEPQPAYHARIRRERSCTLVPHCVLGAPRKVSAVQGSSGGAFRLDLGAPASDQPARGAGGMECVAAGPVLRSLGLGNGSRTGRGNAVDLLSIDIEGVEADVLRCFPFREFSVHAVLMETDKVHDMRQLDRFWHRHGYANVQTFAGPVTVRIKERGPAVFLDNLFVYRGIAKQPPATYPMQMHCSRAARHHTLQGRYCRPYHVWEPREKPWGECTSD